MTKQPYKKKSHKKKSRVNPEAHMFGYTEIPQKSKPEHTRFIKRKK